MQQEIFIMQSTLIENYIVGGELKISINNIAAFLFFCLFETFWLLTAKE